MKTSSSKTSYVAALGAALVVAGCGGGGDCCAVVPATEQVPATASQSTFAFIAYLKLLVASAADMLEPVDTSSVVPPTDDVGDPQVVE